MKILASTKIASFARGAMWGGTALSQVNIVRLGAHHGAAVASDGALLVAVPVRLEEEDVTGEIDAERFQAALDMDRGVMREVLLHPTWLVVQAAILPRGRRQDFPDLSKVVKSMCGEPMPVNRMTLNGKFLARIAQALEGEDKRPEIAASTTGPDAPVLLRPLRHGHENTYLGHELPWALLMPLKEPA